MNTTDICPTPEDHEAAMWQRLTETEQDAHRPQPRQRSRAELWQLCGEASALLHRMSRLAVDSITYGGHKNTRPANPAHVTRTHRLVDKAWRRWGRRLNAYNATRGPLA